MNFLRLLGTLIGAVVLYILSIGPAVMLWPDGGKTVEGFYDPLIHAIEACPAVHPAAKWYVGVWKKIGGR